MKKKYRRKYFVNGQYQIPQAVTIVLANTTVVILAAGLLSWFYLIAWDGSMAVSHNEKIPHYVAFSILITTLVSVLISLRRSRKIAGMMKKLHTVLENAGNGVFPEKEFVFRKSDYFRQLAVPLNACLEQLQKNDTTDYTLVKENLKNLIDRMDEGHIDYADIRHHLACMAEELE